MVIDINGPSCRCGNNGCLEAYAGDYGIARRAKNLLSNNEKSTIINVKSLEDKEPAGVIHEVIRAAKKNDRLAIEILEKTGWYLGIGITNLINLFNPEIVIIGGWVGIEVGEIILPVINSTIREHALKYPLRFTKIVTSKLTDQAIVIGAATAVLRKFLQPPKIKNIISF
jgi:predicted NBD/HSP70 family sugar kinase